MTTLASRPPPTAGRRRSGNPEATERIVRIWFFTYVVLWLSEGALRKWILPGLNQPLYFARDMFTVVTLLLVLCRGVGREHLIGVKIALGLSALLVVVGGLQVIGGVVSLPVVLIGVDTYVIPLLALALVSVSTRRERLLGDVVRLVRFALPIQAGLVILQVTSPLSSYVNRAGDEGSIGFTTTGDVARASGSFSSPSGLSAYAAVAVALLLSHLLSPGTRLRPGVLVQLASATVVVALGGSRGAILSVAVVAVGALIWVTINGGAQLRKVARVGMVLTAAYLAYEAVRRLFPSVLAAFSQRIDDAGDVEDPVDRIINGGVEYWQRARFDNSWLGDGMGAHTIAGQRVGSTATWVEIDLTRWVADLGLLGLLLVILRQGLSVLLLAQAVRASRKTDRPTALLATLAVSLALLTGSVTAPGSQQAFAVVTVACVWLAWPRRGEARSEPASQDHGSSPPRGDADADESPLKPRQGRLHRPAPARSTRPDRPPSRS